MPAKNTRNRERLLNASRRRHADAVALLNATRFAGAMYLGGYAVECALASLICFKETKDQFEDTSIGRTLEGSQMHNLNSYLIPEVSRQLYRGPLKSHWMCVLHGWRYNELRYRDTEGERSDAQKFLDAFGVVHRFLLKEQGATS